MFLYYVPAFVILVISFSLYIPILRQINSGLSEIKKSVQKKLFMYIMVYSYCILPGKTLNRTESINLTHTFEGLVMRVQHFFSPDPIFPLFMITALSFPLQGFLNCIVYAASRKGVLRVISNCERGHPALSELEEQINKN